MAKTTLRLETLWAHNVVSNIHTLSLLRKLITDQIHTSPPHSILSGKRNLMLIINQLLDFLLTTTIHILYNTTTQIWGIWKLRPAYSPETPNLGQNRWCFVPCDLEIWWMTLENNRAPLLCCFKFCATFHSHRCIQTGVAVRKRPIWVKFDNF